MALGHGIDWQFRMDFDFFTTLFLTQRPLRRDNTVHLLKPSDKAVSDVRHADFNLRDASVGGQSSEHILAVKVVNRSSFLSTE